MNGRRAAFGQHNRGGTGSTRGTHIGDLEGAEVDDFDQITAPHALVVAPNFVRLRITEAEEQMHALIVERLRSARRPQELASDHVLRLGLLSLVDARKTGTRNDIRCARLAVAATLILLAEMDDRPEVPPSNRSRRGGQGKVRSTPDFTLPDAA